MSPRPPPDPLVAPPIGSWIRVLRSPAYEQGWHRFAGDVAWRPEWRGPALVTACGERTPPAAAVGEIPSRATRPDDAPVCPRCAHAA